VQGGEVVCISTLETVTDSMPVRLVTEAASDTSTQSHTVPR
jgi:hypothetical protein